MKATFNEFRNNLNYIEAEHIEEHKDGTLLRKVVHDNGFGIKKMTETGIKIEGIKNIVNNKFSDGLVEYNSLS